MMSAQEAILEKLTRRLAYETNAKMIGTYVWTSVMVVVILTFYDYYASLQSFGKSVVLVLSVYLISSILVRADYVLIVFLESTRRTGCSG